MASHSLIQIIRFHLFFFITLLLTSNLLHLFTSNLPFHLLYTPGSVEHDVLGQGGGAPDVQSLLVVAARALRVQELDNPPVKQHLLQCLTPSVQMWYALHANNYQSVIFTTLLLYYVVQKRIYKVKESNACCPSQTLNVVREACPVFSSISLNLSVCLSLCMSFSFLICHSVCLSLNLSNTNNVTHTIILPQFTCRQLWQCPE